MYLYVGRFPNQIYEVWHCCENDFDHLGLGENRDGVIFLWSRETRSWLQCLSKARSKVHHSLLLLRIDPKIREQAHWGPCKVMLLTMWWSAHDCVEDGRWIPAAPTWDTTWDTGRGVDTLDAADAHPAYLLSSLRVLICRKGAYQQWFTIFRCASVS